MDAFCFLAAIPMRSEPSDKSEMVSQLVYGEVAEVLRREEKWSLVQCRYDGYKGWIDNKQYAPFSSAATLAESCFLGTPYLWGGRSHGGIDCSGLTQVCFKANGVWLPRDASQQATAGMDVCPCDIQEDDLAFFCSANGQPDASGWPEEDSSYRVTHVGICRGNGTIIHSSGCVRIDKLDGLGIFNGAAYTHRLISVRRVATPE